VIIFIYLVVSRTVSKYQRDNQNPYITTQWPNKKGQTTIYKT